MPASPTHRSTRPPGEFSADSAHGNPDAITLLKADHAQVAGWFDDYRQVWDPVVKMALATRICGALRIHAAIEEEIFYPAYLATVKDPTSHHEAIIEHAAATKLIVDVESSDPADDYYDARMKVLADMVRHHVREEEKPKGLFARAKRSKMDLAALGARLEARRREFIDPAASDLDD